MIQPITLSFLILFLTASAALAQSVRVDKIRGKKAIVDIIEGQIEPGMTLAPSGSSNAFDEFDEAAVRAASGKRNNFVAASAGIAQLPNKISGSSSTTETSLSASVMYGWNKRTYEFGPLFSFTSAKEQNFTASTLRAGGFYDFNFKPHTNSRDVFFGATGQATLGSYKSGTKSGSLFTLLAGGVMKYYPLHPANLAIRVDGGYQYTNRSTKPSQTLTGLVANAYFVFYY
ncbi:MAG: hypothetical protein ACK5RO_04005 [Pseudobdellovibrionaceae bacterium]|jgi:hypothetical protein